jgi:hypothetical protein
VLPRGRNFGQKAQKGPGKNKVCQKNLWPNFGKILPKVAEKGPKNIFERSSLFNSIDTLTETKKNSIKFRIDPFV